MNNLKSTKIIINFIVTCYDKEEYLYGLLEVFKSYNKIHPVVAICYNGNQKNFPCDVMLSNKGHQLGDIDLTINGYNFLKKNNISKFIKLSIDSWLLDEETIINIFNSMSGQKSAYAGNYWFEENSESLSTDIFFADTDYGNIFENFVWDGLYFETSMYKSLAQNNLAVSIINERAPVVPTNRFKCKQLNWTMSHDIKENLSEFWNFSKDNQK